MTNPPDIRPTLIILGASARAAAHSAALAGWRPWCVDLFADRDMPPEATAHRCPPDRYPAGLLDHLDEAPPEAPVLLCGAMENHGPTLRRLAQRRQIWGPTPDQTARLREPGLWSRLSLPRPIMAPHIIEDASCMRKGVTYLLKPRFGSGGRGIRPVTVDEPRGFNPKQHYLQAYIAGQPIGGVYHAGAGRCELRGITRQFVGESAFGMTEPFGYTGSLCPLPNAPPHLWAAMQRLGERLLEAEPFLGLFNVDAILDERGDVWPLEVNPRYSAGMETVEAIGGRPLLEPPDAEAPLEPSPQKAPPESAGVAAKAIAYARPGAPAQAPDLAEAFEIHRELRDVPRPGTPIRPGWPICTLWVHQEADADPEGARRGLAALMDRLYTHLV